MKDIDTKELIEIYKAIDEYIKDLEGRKESINQQEDSKEKKDA